MNRKSNERPSSEAMAVSTAEKNYLSELKRFYSLRKDIDRVYQAIERLSIITKQSNSAGGSQ